MAKCIAEPLSRKDIRIMADKIRIIEGNKGKFDYLFQTDEKEVEA